MASLFSSFTETLGGALAVTMTNEVPQQPESRVGEISLGRKISLSRRHAAALEAQTPVEINTQKIPFQERANSNSPPEPLSKILGAEMNATVKKSQSKSNSMTKTPPKPKSPANKPRSTKTTVSFNSNTDTPTKPNTPKPKTPGTKKTNTPDTKRSPKTTVSLQRALALMQKDHAQLQAKLEEEKRELQAQLKSAQEEKNSAMQSAKLQVESLQSEKAVLLTEKEALEKKVEELQASLSKVTQESNERLQSMMAGQEQLEQALDLVHKQNKPWWQCFEP